MKVVVTRDVTWLKQLHFQPDDVTGVLELDTEFTIMVIDGTNHFTSKVGRQSYVE